MKQIRIAFLTLLAGALLAVTGCKDDDPDNVAILSILADGTDLSGADVQKDLNGASSATDVPLDAVITITFDKAITHESAETNIKLTQGGTDVPFTEAHTDAVFTITPNDPLERGTDYVVSIGGGLEAEDGGSFTAVTRTFTTEGRAPVVVPNENAMIAYWPFDGSPDDLTGAYPADNVVDITYGADRFGLAGSTASFDGDKSIIEVLDADRLVEGDDFTVSFWVKTNSTNHVNENGDPASHFVFGLGAFFGFQFEISADFSSVKLAQSYELADDTKTGEDLWFNGSGEDANNGGWQGWDFVADLTGSGGVASLMKDKWAHVICTYNASEKQGRMYINGELMKSQDFDLWPDADPKRTVTGVTYRGVAPEVEDILAFGFIKSIDSELWAAEPWANYNLPTSNHFKGDLDDVRFFNAPFSEADAQALYDAEKP